MNRNRAIGYLICGLGLSCGGGDLAADASFGELDQSIVRGEEEAGFPAVVLLHAQGASGFTRCTGTYVEDRVVLTAAHCIRPDLLPGGLYVYHGTDFETDVAVLPNIPAPGEPSVWARAETSLVHPDYDPVFNYPDLAIAYLDRRLPMRPLELYRDHVGRKFVGRDGTMVGWGGSRALVADISVVEGAGIKRSGEATILGSPTEADFHDDDPNPGILVPSIRRDLLKTDGRAPNANGCAGDSGGPLFLPTRGRPEVAGVGMWTGLFCEDYSIFTRVEPFERFFHDAFKRAGGKPVIPQLECVRETREGDLRAYFGYDNQNGISVDIPHSRRNFLSGDTEGLRPEHFLPGDNEFVFGVTFDERSALFYHLNPPAGRSTTLFVNKRSRRCAGDEPLIMCEEQCESSLAAECSDQSIGFDQCVAECMAFTPLFAGGCEAAWNGYLSCVTALPPAAENWLCLPDFLPQPMPPLCEAEFFEALICAGF
jgi:hypothetical protein